ncbi:MAG: hypothetical protein WD066_20475 [Planctomycetaceae bacterium]
MNEILTIDEINERYPDEWIIIGDPDLDESLQVLGGTVLLHGKDRDEVYRRVAALPTPLNIATHDTGEVPDDMVIVR